MNEQIGPFAPPPGRRGLADLEKPRGFSQIYRAYTAAQGRLLLAPFQSLRTPRQVREGVVAGSMGTWPLGLVHGLTAFAALFRGDWAAAALHGALFVMAVLAARAILNGRSVWPCWFVFFWLAFEMTLAEPLLGYEWGRTGI